MWKVLNAMSLVYMKYCMEQAVHTLFLFVHVITKLLSLLFIKFYDNILPLLLYHELFHG